MDKKELMFLRDMLDGSLNRMMVTDSIDELDDMVLSSFSNLNILYLENLKRLRGVSNE